MTAAPRPATAAPGDHTTAAAPSPPAGPPVLAAARAFGVTFGPSAVLLGAEAAGLAASAGALARGRRPTLPALAGAAIAAAHRLVARPWMARWGASEADLRRPLPGDELVPDPASESTRAVTIDAPPEAVWPWIAQLGQ
ncbi:MAG TPA: hypothetical protein VK279_04320, partial [Solirubrobacteraceae bacterium]|nr:hypothetical protein [Solirubrobacteraceae bacterium]